MNKLLSAYSGDHAVHYDSIRSGSPRWKNEVDAMERFLREIRPASVVDCPFGTGRWIPQYQALGIRTVGVDLSEGMLKEAHAKLRVLGGDAGTRFELLQGSIFELDRMRLPYAPELIACIRFVNWVSFKEVCKVLDNLTALPSKHMILGASVVPSDSSWMRRLRMAAALKLTNLRHWKRPPQYVHSEDALLAQFSRCGWTVVDKAAIFESASRVNYFYRLARV
jgi:SAM-dependent methyltransferase